MGCRFEPFGGNNSERLSRLAVTAIPFVVHPSSIVRRWIADRLRIEIPAAGLVGSFLWPGILFIWLPATLLFFMLAGEMVNARYILHSLPPLFLVAFSRVHRTAAISTLAATLLLSSILSIEDYRFVNSYREWVTKVIIPLQQQGFRIWSATESGLRFYLEQRGIQTLDNTDIRPRGGDLIVRQASFHYGLSKDLEPLLISIAEKDLMEPFPIRTFARAAGAGFYDSHFGIVPFSFSHVPLDHLELAQVSPFVSDLPQVVPADFSSVPVWFPGGVL